MKRQGTFVLIAMILAMVLNLAPAPQMVQAAVPTELFFSEFIEGTSNNKALEIYNDTGAAVDLAAGGYNIQMFFNGSASAGLTINLNGVVADGDVFVIAQSSAVATILAQADQTNGAGWFNGDDAVVLRKGAQNLDVIGQIGFDPGSQWGVDLVSTADNTLRRKNTVCAGDPDGSNPFDPSGEWDGYATDTFDGLGSHSAICAPSLLSPKINEFSASTTGTDVEFVEIYGSPNTDYSAYKLLEIEGDASLAVGTIDEVISLGSMDANGLNLVSLPANALENGTISLLLVKDFSGALNNDLDTDNNGTFDVTPWSEIVDSVAVNDGGTGDITYGATTLSVSYDGLAFAPGGASRFPDGFDTDAATDWVRNDFDLAGIPGFAGTPIVGEAYNTPGALNQLVSIDVAPYIASSNPGNGASDVAANASLQLLFNEAVDVSSDWFSLTCSTTGAHPASVTGGPVDFTLDPDTDFVSGETCALSVYAAKVTDQDVNDPPDNMMADFVLSFSIQTNVCDLTYTPIYNIQGSGLVAAITGTVTTQGVVVGDFETSSSMSGFYMQDLTGDGDQATSDGIFVYTGNNNFVSTGQVVRVTGYARERFNQTTINGSNSNTAVVPLANIVDCGSGSIAPIEVNMPFTSPEYLEGFEGMLVKFPQSLVISEYFNYDRFGEIILSLPFEGQSRMFTPTSVVEPGAAAIDLAYQNSLRRITLDDVNSAQNPAALRHPNGQPFSLTNMFRGGDLVQNAIGVLGYDFNLYRIMPTAPADFTAVNPRPAAPEDVGGNLKIAAMNTLNYFLTLDYPTGDPLDNQCGPLLNVECRGADADQPDEFSRQRAKLLAALSGLDASVIGLNELENTTGVEPLADIVAGLNDLLGPGAYAYVDTGVIGSDAIKVGLIYRPADVTPVGSFALLDSSVDTRFLDTKNRPSLAQTFEENSTGARFTVAVNHLKSKGSDCNDVDDPDIGDGQGNCNLTRMYAAQAMVDWLAVDPTGSGDPDFIIMGDLNSYAMEDPIDAIKAGPDDIFGTEDDYTNLIFDYQGLFAYSYVFDGQNGYLDHALANAGMATQVTGVIDWHINADEADVVDYDTSFKPLSQENLYEPNAYRASDHDAVIVGLNLTNLPPTVEAGGPYAVSVNESILLSAVGYDPEGKPLSYAWDLDNDGIFETLGQEAWFTAGTLPGIFPVHVMVTDVGGLTASDQTYVAVFDRNNGFVTGGGWIDSPAGAYTFDPLLTGKAEFSFDAKYVKKNASPVASLSWMIDSAGLYFTGTSFDWLVVDGNSAWLRGSGEFNGMAGYTFLLSVVDGSEKLGGDGMDYVRLQILEQVSGMLVYDSQPGAIELAPPDTLLGGGSIAIH